MIEFVTLAFLIFSIFLESDSIPLTVILYLTKVSFCSNYLHFISFNLRLAFFIFWSIALTYLICSSFILKWIITLSRYTFTNFPRYFLNTLFINLWKVTDALYSLNSITLNWYYPVLIRNAIFSISYFLNHICQYADTKSRLVNYLLLQNLLHVLLMLGNGYLSDMVILFNSS